MEHKADSVIHRENEGEQVVEIVDTGEHRSLYFASRSLQSRMSLSNPQQLLLSYTRYMLLGLPILEHPSNILLIGIGVGYLMSFL
jgi:spermidine synthase